MIEKLKHAIWSKITDAAFIIACFLGAAILGIFLGVGFSLGRIIMEELF